MSGKEHAPALVLRMVAAVAAVALVTILATITTTAQSSVPPTAREAATMPHYASRLAHPAGRFTPRPPARRSSPDYGVVYENGPVNGTTDAWSINLGFAVSDSVKFFTNVETVEFYTWLIPGDVLTSVEVDFGSQPFGTDLFHGTVNLTQSDCTTNQYGYYVCFESGNLDSYPSVSGNAWMTLQNASVPSGDPVYWDENSGVGCHSDGCPSQATENTLGTIPSESFDIIGNGPPNPPCFQPGGNLQVLHDFTPQEGAPAGVTLDRGGKLDGSTRTGGDNGQGLAFQESPAGSGWIFDPLYSFVGGYNGGNPDGVIVGPDGSLYGSADGGVQSCGSDGSLYCGLAFNLKPQPTACLTALCSWTERVLYRFSGDSNGSPLGSVNAADHDGNLYGVSVTGGGGKCNNGLGCGTVFKLTRSGGSWTESILYTFTGGSDGYSPTQVLVGNDGNLYGTAGGGAYGDGVVFQLTPSGGQWTESVLHNFEWSNGGAYPSYLLQDSAGNLYGMTLWYDVGPIFMLQKSGDGWTFNNYYVQHPYGSFEYLNNLAVDANGNLYGTGNGGEGCSGQQCDTRSDTSYFWYSFVFKARPGTDGWQYQDLAFFGNIDFSSSGSLAVDAQGNLYGTTRNCGANHAGSLWQLAP